MCFCVVKLALSLALTLPKDVRVLGTNPERATLEGLGTPLLEDLVSWL